MPSDIGKRIGGRLYSPKRRLDPVLFGQITAFMPASKHRVRKFPRFRNRENVEAGPNSH
jgi:hypothetical protein